MFITFEGLDFSGKSTQIKLLADRLHSTGHHVLVLREPGGTLVGEKIRSILLDPQFVGMTAVGEFFLFSASRAQLVENIIRPELAAGTVVICDRFYDSSTAYQGYGRGIPLEAIRTVNQLATAGLVPDLTFFIDIPTQEVERRIRERKEGKDRMESSGTAFYERVRQGYLKLASEEGRFRVLDGMQSIDQVHAAVWSAVSTLRHQQTNQYR
jgi:dTMP kinase